MKNLMLIIIGIITTVLAAKSQDLLWQMRYIPERQDERFYYPKINQIEDDLFMVNLIRVDTIKNGIGNTFLITRLSPYGDTLWNKRFVLSNNVSNNFDLLKYDNDTYMIYGIVPIPNPKKFYNAFFNNSGELFEENYFDKIYNINVYVSNDFDFMLSSDSLDNKSKFYKSNKDFVLKDSLILNFVNEDTSIKYPEYLSNFKCKSRDKGYLISSRQYDMPFNYNYLIKTDSILNVQWIQKYNSKLIGYDTSRFYFLYILQKDDGSFLGILNNIDPQGDSTFAIIHFDSLGNNLSTKFYGKKLLYIDSKGRAKYSFMRVFTMTNTSDSGFVLGMDYRFPTIAKFDKEGELEWLRSYPVPDTNLPLGLWDIYQMSDNNFIVSLLEFDEIFQGPPPGLPLNTFLYKISNNASDVRTDIKEMQELKIIPNPGNQYIKIRFPYDLFDLYNIKIYNSVGELMDKIEKTDLLKLVANEFELDLSSFGNGIYYVVIQSRKGIYSAPFTVIK
ncbi:MAG: T9SS type A sorting domain-containing protein [Bacteroidetes bacterium]|nr:MAG: T9SS type A sorting domain-containing protein [Bacteroidota bacterium]